MSKKSDVAIEKKTEQKGNAIRKCRVCGCTDNNACEGGCHWVEQDLCSNCVDISENETAEEKLTREAKKGGGSGVPTTPIFLHLMGKIKTSEELKQFILLPNKTLSKCYQYVYEQARSQLNGASGWLDDNVVYQMAEEYYRLDEAEIEKKKQEKRRTKDDKQKIETEKKSSEIPKKEKVPKTVKQEETGESKGEFTAQMTLFD